MSGCPMCGRGGEDARKLHVVCPKCGGCGRVMTQVLTNGWTCPRCKGTGIARNTASRATSSPYSSTRLRDD